MSGLSIFLDTGVELAMGSVRTHAEGVENFGLSGKSVRDQVRQHPWESSFWEWMSALGETAETRVKVRTLGSTASYRSETDKLAEDFKTD